jgi:hypothetical protein
MRRLLIGLDANGKSCVVENAEVSFDEVMPGIGLASLYGTRETPPPCRPAGVGDLLPMDIEPGLARWVVLEWAPGMAFPNHHTDTLDFDVVLTGSVELILDDGAHSLVPGDCVVIPGVDHAWRAGPDGCRVGYVLIGTPPPS